MKRGATIINNASINAYVGRPDLLDEAAGGVDTRELDSQQLQSRRQAGLYFIGEVVDVTGWLGGYNFQWAWASTAACAHGLTKRELHAVA